MKWSRFQPAGIALLIATIYVTGAKLGLRLAFVAEQVTVVWPPTGIALCAVILFGYRIWPAIALGAFIANITTHAPVVTSLGIASGNTLEALAGAYLLNRIVRFRPALERFSDLFGLIFFGAIISTIVSATIGVVSLCITGMQPWQRFGPIWANWMLGDAMGVVIVAPVILTISTGASRRCSARGALRELVFLVIALMGIGAYVFGRRTPLGSGYDPPDYAMFPILVWAALRLGTCGTAISVFVIATLAVLGTVHGFGPFTGGNTNDNLISLELFLFVASVTGLILAIAKTQRDQAQEASHHGEERYRSLVLASSQVVWSANAIGDVVEDLPSWRTFTGQTKEEMMGRGWAQRVHSDDIEQVVELWERSLATGTPHENEFRVLSADDKYRHVFARAVPVIERDGRVREWVGTLTDITEKKKSDREMQQANRRKDEFLAMLAHELRNPLAPIRNAVQVLHLAGKIDSQGQWARDVIQRQLQHLTRLVDDLLDVSRITQGKITLHKETVELATIITRAVETSRPLIDSRRQQLTVTVPSDPIRLEGDATRLTQVVANLLNNAAKYTQEGGHIWISAAIVGEQSVLRVKDTGVGMPADVLPRVFDLFTQAERSLDRSQGGLGIGLTLVRNLVEMHGGKVEAFSAGHGQGSEFVVHLPALRGKVHTTEVKTASASQSPPSTSLRVLVVDDNLDSAESLALLLQFSGHNVRVANEADTALETACAFKPQVIVLDIGLPKMDGYQVAQRLRQKPQLENPFLIALTGYGQNEDRQRSKEAGFDYHLVKPVDPQGLQSLISSLAGR